MNKIMLPLILLTAVCVAFSSCDSKPDTVPENPASISASGSTPSASASAAAPEVSASVAAPAATAAKPEITEELMDELAVRMGITNRDGVNANGSLGEFVVVNPDFLYEQLRVLYSSDIGDETLYDLIAVPNAKEDLLGRPRLAKFVENYKAGIADSIAIISTGNPIPVWVNVFTYDGKGKSYSAERYGLEEVRTVTVPELRETDTEWIIIDEKNWQMRYPKNGYEAIPLAENKGEVTEAEAQKLIEKFAAEKYPPGGDSTAILSVAPAEEQEFGGEYYYVFDGLDAKGSHDNIGTGFAVAKDLSHFYEIEPGFGMWLLQARAKKAA